MTNHARLTDRTKCPRRVTRALKHDLNHADGLERTERLLDYYVKVSEIRKRPKLKAMAEATWTLACKKRKIAKQLKRQVKSFLEEIDDLFLGFHRFIRGSFEPDGKWKRGVQANMKHFMFTPLNTCGRMKVAIVKLAQLLYPNSNKQAPHTGMVTYNGMRRDKDPKGRCWQPVTMWVISRLQWRNVWSMTNTTVNDPDQADWEIEERREWHKELWEGIKPKERIWDVRKYQGDSNDITLSANFKFQVKKYQRPNVKYRTDPEWDY